MHKAALTHVATSATTIIAAAHDGTVTFWSRDTASTAVLHFIKSFRAHTGPLSALYLHPDSDTLVTTSQADNSVKLFSISTFDMRDFRVLPFTPASSLCVIRSTPHHDFIIIPLQSRPAVAIFPLRDIATKHTVLTLPHTAHLTHIAHNRSFQALISIDAASVIQYWRLPTPLPSDEAAVSTHIPQLSFRSKLTTNLFDLARHKTSATALTVSNDGLSFAVAATDRLIRLFQFRTGKLLAVLDESLPAITSAASLQSSHLSEIPSQEFGRRMARERQVDAHPKTLAQANLVFDESARFLVYTTVVGVKIVHIPTASVSAVLGIRESAERFLSIAICDTVITDTGELLPPLLVASSFDSQRIFLFSAGEPTKTGRDVFNERPIARGTQHTSAVDQEETVPKRVTLHTTAGDIGFAFVSDRTPKTIQNFCTHARNKYYDGVIFHRVIKNFMIQTGDPSGDGTGGESIWGGEFEDEIDDRLTHDTGTVSMANAGKNSNGSVCYIQCSDEVIIIFSLV